jgi:hypothetical protein
MLWWPGLMTFLRTWLSPSSRWTNIYVKQQLLYLSSQFLSINILWSLQPGSKSICVNNTKFIQTEKCVAIDTLKINQLEHLNRDKVASLVQSGR